MTQSWMSARVTLDAMGRPGGLVCEIARESSVRYSPDLEEIVSVDVGVDAEVDEVELGDDP